MPNYQDFLKMARERQERKKTSSGGVSFTRHAEYKMKQYGLSVQRVRTVMRNPRRREEGIAKNTIAVMQPVSTKRKDGQETWSQEIWVMYVIVESRKSKVESPAHNASNGYVAGHKPILESPGGNGGMRVISAWRYPGVSPKRSPIPEEILREIEEGSIFEEDGIIG
jgi:hypothetical protein